ncbi:MAG: 4-(cytidine 5'-diphospho)-2-C-methyl-D-erythritol kinase [Spirochaetes bacterium]|nr:4-(cytidine 5'-diphospho)-2-C-methyl-D-erythritol kinase [Spirochaetota bacterium]
MDSITLLSPAKLNLSLNLIPPRDENGYFRVLFLNTGVTLYDTVRISRIREKTALIDETRIDRSENIALKAARLILDRFDPPAGVRLTVEKTIPLRAGLGGGSTDAASVINGMDTLFGLEMDRGAKLEIASLLGMDVCYCVTGGLCRVEGTGEKVRKTNLTLPTLDLLVATPREKKPSTAWAYSLIDERHAGRSLPKFDLLLDAVSRGDKRGIARNLHNDFDRPVSARYPWLRDIADRMRRQGAQRTMLAGSGLSLFGVFETSKDALRASERLRSKDLFCRAVRTL